MAKIDDRMDLILDSISEKGIDNISEEDKLFLKYEAEGMDYYDIIKTIHIELNPEPLGVKKEEPNIDGILSICFPTPEEEGLNEEEFIHRYKLNGKIFVALGENWEENEYEVYIGPSVGDQVLSDSVYIDEYLKDLCLKLGINENTFDVGIAENLHQIYANNQDEAKKYISLILREMKKEGFKIEYLKA